MTSTIEDLNRLSAATKHMGTNERGIEHADFVSGEIKKRVAVLCSQSRYGLPSFDELDRIREDVNLQYPSPNYSGERVKIEPVHQQALYSKPERRAYGTLYSKIAGAWVVLGEVTDIQFVPAK